MTANISLKLGDANFIKKDTNYENERKIVIIDNVTAVDKLHTKT